MEALAAAPELKQRLMERTLASWRRRVITQRRYTWKTRRLCFFCSKRASGSSLRRNNSDFTDLRRPRGGSFAQRALLRPVAQDTILPTVAYIGGPAELAYLAQSQVIYDRLSGRMPVVTSREFVHAGGIAGGKLLSRYHLDGWRRLSSIRRI